MAARTRRNEQAEPLRGSGRTSLETTAASVTAAGLILGTMPHLIEKAHATPGDSDPGHTQGLDRAADAAAIPQDDPLAVAFQTISEGWTARPETHQASADDVTVLAKAAEAAHVETADGSAATITAATTALPNAPTELDAMMDGTSRAGSVDAISAASTAPADLVSQVAHEISGTLTGLFERMEAGSPLSEISAGLSQDIATTASRIVSDITASVSAATEPLENTIQSAFSEAFDLGEDLAAIPASLLGAENDAGSGGLLSDLFDLGDTAETAMDGGSIGMLHIGFLGQSYTETADPHDGGFSPLGSGLHGLL